MMIISALRGRVAAAVVFGLMSLPVCAGEVRVAAASNFAAPMERIVALFEKESGHTVKASLGSTGKLYSQIKGGAPFDVLLAADEATRSVWCRKDGFRWFAFRLCSGQAGVVECAA